MAEVDAAEILAPVHQMRNFMLIAGAVIAVVVTVSGVFVAVGLLRPIVAMTKTIGRLAEAAPEVALATTQQHDEIDEMRRRCKCSR